MADLRVVTGGQNERPLSGEEVMHEVAELLAERLPLVPHHDPYKLSAQRDRPGGRGPAEREGA